MEKIDLNYIDGVDCILFACADLPLKCSFCGKDYKEHEDFENVFQGIFDENGKIACCKECFKKQ